MKPLQSLGYRHAGAIIAGDIAQPEAVKLLKRDTKRFARQQLSWLRSEREVHWTSAGDALDMEGIVDGVAAFARGDEPEYRWANPAAANL